MPANASPEAPTRVSAVDVSGVRPGSGEERIAQALLVCVGRWGIAKTTVEDVAREAGVSRATVYRLFPGGKAAISQAAAEVEVHRLVSTLVLGLAGIDDLEGRLSEAMCIAATFFADHEALNFLRRHEPAEFERLVRLDCLESLLATTGRMVGPVLRPVFDTDAEAATAAVWVGRLIASYVVNPSPTLDLTDRTQARAVVRAYIVPGLRPSRPPTT